MSMRWSEHPSVYVDGDRPRLKVLRSLKADPTLPKHLVDGKVMFRGRSMTVDEYINSPDGMTAYRRSQYGADECGPSPQGRRQSVFTRLWRWIRSRFEHAEIPPETFEKAHEMLDKNIITDDIEKAAAQLKSLILKTRSNGQVALAARLEKEHRTIIGEVVLKKNGLDKYLTEADVVSLLQKSDRGIRVDFWNDYPDIVPEDVIESKRRADALRVFDNWCVMHYDPEGSALKQMKAEEWRRDPILFGLVIGSDRLYYVRDWTTGKDDLTVGKVCGILGLVGLRDAGDYGEVASLVMSVPDSSSIVMEVPMNNQ